MKKTLRIIAVAMVAVMLCITFVSCGGKTLSGEYRSNETLGSYVSYTFKGNKVEYDSYVLGSKVESASYEGTYKIDGGEITITVGEGDTAESQTFAFEELDDGSIKIGMVACTKVEK